MRRPYGAGRDRHLPVGATHASPCPAAGCIAPKSDRLLVSRPRNTSPFALEVGWCNNAGESEDVPPGTRPREVVEYLRLAPRSTTNLWDGTLGRHSQGS